MSREGKVKVTSGAVMKTHAAWVQKRVFYNLASAEEDRACCVFFGATQHVRVSRAALAAQHPSSLTSLKCKKKNKE